MGPLVLLFLITSLQTPIASGTGCIMVDQPTLTSPTLLQTCVRTPTSDPSATGTSTLLDPEMC